jgi:hypothetical protein
MLDPTVGPFFSPDHDTFDNKVASPRSRRQSPAPGAFSGVAIPFASTCFNDGARAPLLKPSPKRRCQSPSAICPRKRARRRTTRSNVCLLTGSIRHHTRLWARRTHKASQRCPEERCPPKAEVARSNRVGSASLFSLSSTSCHQDPQDPLTGPKSGRSRGLAEMLDEVGEIGNARSFAEDDLNAFRDFC